MAADGGGGLMESGKTFHDGKVSVYLLFFWGKEKRPRLGGDHGGEEGMD